MTQSNLLQLAKQGDPEAMAALMNLTLQPRGVMARVVRLENYLHISFSSKRPLNRKTLVKFTRRGLSSLEGEFFETVKTVKIYGIKADEDLPLWTEQFEVEWGQAAEPWTASAENSQEKWPAIALALPPVPVEMLHRFTQALATRFQPLTTLQSATLSTRLSEFQTGLQQAYPQLQHWRTQFPWISYLSNYQLTALLVASTAFLSGGVFGLMANSRTDHAVSPSLNRLSSAPGATDRLAVGAAPEAIATQQQLHAKTYLQKMNQAQQVFYRKHNRFAPSLEELERSASIISQSSAYTYKLTTPNKTQAVLTALPKPEGLKGYIAAVALPKGAEGTGDSITTLCETTTPSATSTVLPLQVGYGIQCPPRYSKVF